MTAAIIIALGVLIYFLLCSEAREERERAKAQGRDHTSGLR